MHRYYYSIHCPVYRFTVDIIYLNHVKIILCIDNVRVRDTNFQDIWIIGDYEIPCIYMKGLWIINNNVISI